MFCTIVSGMVGGYPLNVRSRDDMISQIGSDVDKMELVIRK